MKDKFRIVGLGEVLWDLLPDGKKLGGAPSNFAYHAQAIGGRVSLVSRVGNDDMGRDALALLKSKGLDLALVSTDSEHPTGTVDVKLDENGSPDFIIHEGVAWDHIPWVPELAALASECDAVAFGTLGQRMPESRGTVQRFLNETREDCLRIFDINIRQRYYTEETIRACLDRSTVLKLNEDELPLVSSLLGYTGDRENVLNGLLRDFPLRVIALTMGPAGSLLRSRDGSSLEKPPKVRVADAVGAGDAFTAVLCMGLLENRPLTRINAVANRYAAWTCTRSGAMPEVPEEIVDGLWEQATG